MSGSPVLRISHLSRNVSTPRWSGSGAIAGAEGIAVRTGRLTALTGPPGVGSSEILRTVFNAHIGGTGCLVYRARNGEAVQLSDLDDDSRRALRDREVAMRKLSISTRPRYSGLLVTCSRRALSAASCATISAM